MKFIKLHDKEDNSTVVISVDNILAVTRKDGSGFVQCREGNYDYTVTESVEKIYEMLIKLTQEGTASKPICS